MESVDPLFRYFIIDKQLYWGSPNYSHVSDNLRNLLDAMLNVEPMLRPSVADIISHPWMTEQDEASAEEAAAEMRARQELRTNQPRVEQGDG